MNEEFRTIMEMSNRSQLDDMLNYTSIASAANVFAIPMVGKAFRNIKIATNYDVPQVETATAAGTVTADPGGDATVTVTSSGMAGSPKAITVALLKDDDANAIASKIRAALTADTAVSGKFTVSGATDKIILTAKVPAANDTTLNIAIAAGTATGVTAAPSSANTTASSVAAKTVTVTDPAIGCEIHLEYTSTKVADFTWTMSEGSTLTWLAGSAPSLTDGKVYRMVFYYYDTDVWHGDFIGGW